MIKKESKKTSISKDFFESLRASASENLEQNLNLLKKDWRNANIEIKDPDDSIPVANEQVAPGLIKELDSFVNEIKQHHSFEDFAELIVSLNQNRFKQCSQKIQTLFGITVDFKELSLDMGMFPTISDFKTILFKLPHNSKLVIPSSFDELISSFHWLNESDHVTVKNNLYWFANQNVMGVLSKELLSMLILARGSFTSQIKISLFFNDETKELTWESHRTDPDTGMRVTNLRLKRLVFSPISTNFCNLESFEQFLENQIFSIVSETYKEYLLTSKEFNFANFVSGKKKLSMFDDEQIKEKLKKVMLSQYIGLGLTQSEKERLSGLIQEALFEQ